MFHQFGFEAHVEESLDRYSEKAGAEFHAEALSVDVLAGSDRGAGARERLEHEVLVFGMDPDHAHRCVWSTGASRRSGTRANR